VAAVDLNQVHLQRILSVLPAGSIVCERPLWMEKSFVVDEGRNSMGIQHSTLVAAFQDRAMAEQAIERLREAGFQNDHLHYSGGNTRAGVLSAIKNLFTGENYPTSSNLVGDLENMGIPDEEAEYYAHEHQVGHPIVAIDAGEHVREAEEILQQNGAFRYGMNSEAASVLAEQDQQMLSNSEIQGIGNYTSLTDSTQPSDLDQEMEDDDNPFDEGEHTSGYLQTDNALRGVDSTQSPINPTPGSERQNKVNQQAFHTEASSGEGQAPDYAQERTLGDAASYYPPSGLDQQPTSTGGQDQALPQKPPEQKPPDESSERS